MEFELTRIWRFCTVVAMTIGCGTVPPSSAMAGDSAAGDFLRDIRPILAKHCVACHGSKRQEGGLRLDNRNDGLSGGDSGKAVVARDPVRSLLIRRVASSDQSLRMPLDKRPLAPAQVKLLKSWIAAGADWPKETAKQDSAHDHWSFQPIRRPATPATGPTHWTGNPIDTFVLAGLQRAGLPPSRQADRTKLLRRLSLDLTGLPPEPQAIDAFVADRRPDAFARVVDRLLASPHFGERWGQHWLDLARYADSDGYEMDHPRPNAWQWRDWVIRATNSDLAFDQFTIEQLAGDLLPQATHQQKLATGFHRNTLTNRENGIDQEEFRIKAVVDRVNTTGTVWLGLSIECAECHSHKYDPIRQHDYYRMFAFFNNGVDEADLAVAPTESQRLAFQKSLSVHHDKVKQLEAELESALSADRDPIEKRLQALQKKAPQLNPVARVFQSRDNTRQTFVHVRGNFLDKGRAASAGVPAMLPTLPAGPDPPDRLDLARWLVDARNPLTARVEANRIWQHLFGAGLVRSPNDFGTQGQPPTHPQLLDWLASELVRQGWSRKGLIRLIVTSATYCQDSARREDLDRVDPLNRLVARQNRYRLGAELVRDQVLEAGGLLSRQVGGPSFYPPLPQAMSQLGFRVHWRADPLAQRYRRGIYLVVRRNLAYPMFTTFDRPDANVTCTRRERSNTPLQSLTQLNDPLVIASARALASRLVRRLGETPPDQLLRTAFRRCLARWPTDEEERSLAAHLQQLRAIYRADPQSAIALAGESRPDDSESIELAAWTVLVRTLMNLDEFVTRE